MSNRALLIGINTYSEAPLRGCVNDVLDMASLLTEQAGFARDEVTLLLDGRATRDAIMQHLRALVRTLQPGDRALFHFSGHGTQLPSATDSGEEDGLDEAICPIDYSWDDLGSFLRDKDFRRELARIPEGVTFVWVSDSCHSGTLSRELRRNAHDSRPRCLPPPSDIAWKIEALRQRGARTPRALRAMAEELRLALIAGCEPDKTSADAVFDGRDNGALTYYLLRELSRHGGLDLGLVPLTTQVTGALAQNGFDQRPMLEGDAEQLRRSFLARPSTAPAAAPPWLGLFSEIERRAAANVTFRRELQAAGVSAGRELAVALKLEAPAARSTERQEAVSRGSTVARTFWWGFHIEISHADLQAFLGAANPVNALVAAIGGATGPAAPFIVLAAGFVAGTLQLLAGLDRGRGVYVSMSWFAPGVFVPTSV